MVYAHIRIPPEVREWVKQQAEREYTTFSHYVRRLILEDMEKKNGK
jgi:predicted DNA-binding protein